MIKEGWQLENVLKGTYVDATRADHPGRFDGENYAYRVADVVVEEDDFFGYGVWKRLGGPLSGCIETEFVFEEGYPDPAAVREHPQFAWLGGEVESSDRNRLRLSQPITGRELYGARLQYFNKIVEDLCGEL